MRKLLISFLWFALAGTGLAQVRGGFHGGYGFSGRAFSGTTQLVRGYIGGRVGGFARGYGGYGWGGYGAYGSYGYGLRFGSGYSPRLFYPGSQYGLYGWYGYPYYAYPYYGYPYYGYSPYSYYPYPYNYYRAPVRPRLGIPYARRFVPRADGRWRR